MYTNNIFIYRQLHNIENHECIRRVGCWFVAMLRPCRVPKCRVDVALIQRQLEMRLGLRPIDGLLVVVRRCRARLE